MPEREILEVDVLIVGGGPAGLAAAYHLRQLNRDISIAVLEKGKEVGAHIISGAVMDPRGISEMMPDWKEKGAPIENPVEEDHVLYLTKTRKFGLPIVPPPLQNHGNYVISLNKFARWFGKQVEENGVDIFPGFTGADLIIENDALVGIRTGDKGIGSSAAGSFTTWRMAASPLGSLLASITLIHAWMRISDFNNSKRILISGASWREASSIPTAPRFPKAV